MSRSRNLTVVSVALAKFRRMLDFWFPIRAQEEEKGLSPPVPRTAADPAEESFVRSDPEFAITSLKDFWPGNQ